MVPKLFVLLSVIPVTLLFIMLNLCEGIRLLQLAPCSMYYVLVQVIAIKRGVSMVMVTA